MRGYQRLHEYLEAYDPIHMKLHIWVWGMSICLWIGKCTKQSFSKQSLPNSNCNSYFYFPLYIFMHSKSFKQRRIFSFIFLYVFYLKPDFKIIHSLRLNCAYWFFSQGVDYGKGEKTMTSQWKNLTVSGDQTWWSRLIATVMSPIDIMYPWYDVVRMALYLWASHPQMYYTNVIRRKKNKSHKVIPTEWHSIKYLLICLKNTQMTETKESLRNCYSQEESKKRWLVNLMY